MITDSWFKFIQWLQQLFCHHEYIYKRRYILLKISEFYECRKCGRIRKTYNVPEKLIVKDDENV